MLRYILRRVAYSIPVLILATMLIFVLVREFGADPARARCLHSRDAKCYPNAKHELGLDKALPVQYVNFMGDFLQGNWGTSQRTDQSVAESIKGALGETAQLALWGVLFSSAIAVTVGVYSANKPYSPGDYLFSGLAFAGIAMPTFWFGLLCIQYLTFELQKWVGSAQPIFYSIPNPVSSGAVDYARELALPVLVLSVQLIAGWSRYQRSSMLEELNSDYIRTARAKGLSRRKVVWKHGLRNSLSALVTVIALDIGGLFGGLIITEKVFSRPGMGTLILDALTNGDTAIILPWMLVTGAFVVLFNLIADVMYGVLDPRVRVS
jgi:peptide/nickel transport system permease protein